MACTRGGQSMNRFKFLAVPVVVAMCFTMAAPKSQAQVSVGVEIGAPPECPYGYYDVAPYNCAPYGYYGPEWYSGGVFIGAGPWFHGPSGFRGHVDTRFHPDHGYHGPLPARGERPDPNRHLDKVPHFKGKETRDGRGNAVRR
jgi:hypothetical protein